MARPNKYFSNIKPNFEKIKEMLEDMHECDVANYFGVTRQSWNNYRKTISPNITISGFPNNYEIPGTLFMENIFY